MKNDISFDHSFSSTLIESFNNSSNLRPNSNISKWPSLFDMIALTNFFGLGFINPATKEYLSLNQFTQRYGLQFIDNKYDYCGKIPLNTNGKQLVEETITPVIAISSYSLLNLGIKPTLRWVTLLNSVCTEKNSNKVTSDIFILTSGNILTTEDGHDWCFVNGEAFYTPFASIIDLLYQTLHLCHPKGPINKEEFASIIRIEQVCEAICNSYSIDDSQILLWGIANDIGGSKSAPKNLVSSVGSKLIDNIATFTQNQVLAGGDGTEGYIWTDKRKAKEIIKSIAYQDYNQVVDTPLSVRTSMFFLNFLTFGELLHEKGFRLSFESLASLSEKISLFYSSILQSTVKSLNEQKAITVFTENTANFLGLNAKSYSLCGTTPITKFQPNIYFRDSESSVDNLSVSLKRHAVSVTPIPSEMIHAYLG